MSDCSYKFGNAPQNAPQHATPLARLYLRWPVTGSALVRRSRPGGTSARRWSVGMAPRSAHSSSYQKGLYIFIWYVGGFGWRIDERLHV